MYGKSDQDFRFQDILVNLVGEPVLLLHLAICRVFVRYKHAVNTCSDLTRDSVQLAYGTHDACVSYDNRAWCVTTGYTVDFGDERRRESTENKQTTNDRNNTGYKI